MAILGFLVRVTGFEPAASWSQTTRATNCATPGSIHLFMRETRYTRKSLEETHFFLAPMEPAALGFDGEEPRRKGWPGQGKGGKRSRPADSYHSIHHQAGGSKFFLGGADKVPAGASFVFPAGAPFACCGRACFLI